MVLRRKIAEFREESGKVSEAPDDGCEHIDDLNTGTAYVALLQVLTVRHLGVGPSVVHHCSLYLVSLRYSHVFKYGVWVWLVGYKLPLAILEASPIRFV